MSVNTRFLSLDRYQRMPRRESVPRECNVHQQQRKLFLSVQDRIQWRWSQLRRYALSLIVLLLASCKKYPRRYYHVHLTCLMSQSLRSINSMKLSSIKTFCCCCQTGSSRRPNRQLVKPPAVSSSERSPVEIPLLLLVHFT